MTTSNKPLAKKPVDGNIFNIAGAAKTAMKKAGVEQTAITEMSERMFKSKSYEEAIAIIIEYVDFDL